MRTFAQNVPYIWWLCVRHGGKEQYVACLQIKYITLHKPGGISLSRIHDLNNNFCRILWRRLAQ